MYHVIMNDVYTIETFDTEAEAEEFKAGLVIEIRESD